MKWISIIVILIIIFISFAENRINNIQDALFKTKLKIRSLEERRSVLRHLENLLKEERPVLTKVEPLIISDLGLAPVVAHDLMKKILNYVGLTGDVRASYPYSSKFFPEPLGVMESNVEVGVKDYDSYLELLNFFENIKETPFYLEEISVGSNSHNMQVKGKIKVRAKFFFLSGG